jgi:hypothetical protein
MNGIKVVLLLCAVSALGGCANYQKFVKDDLKIPYVYIPPNNLDLPYTLIQSTPDGNFLTICQATQLTGIKKENMPNEIQYSDTSTYGVTDTASATFDVKVGKDQLGNADVKYSRINKVKLTLDHGRIVTLPNVGIAEVVRNIAATDCKENIRLIAKEIPDSKFLIPMQLYAYNMDYHILTEDNLDVTAELPKELTQAILTNVGLGYKSSKEVTQAGSNLNIGFRGTPIDASLASILVTEESFSSMVILHGTALPDLKGKLKETEKVIDVTSLVKEILAKK